MKRRLVTILPNYQPDILAPPITFDYLYSTVSIETLLGP
jgi:hypothetical protein